MQELAALRVQDVAALRDPLARAGVWALQGREKVVQGRKGGTAGSLWRALAGE